MESKADISKGFTIQQGPVPSLDHTFSALLEELMPYRNSFQQVRSRMVLFFLKIINIPVQKKLEKLQAAGGCDWFAESIDRTYLECRESLAYFNAYTVYLSHDTKNSYFERVAGVLRSVQQLIATDPEFACALRTYRVPEPVCDRLVVPDPQGYGVLLLREKIVRIPTAATISSETLELLLTVTENVTQDINQLSLGEASGLLRQDWYDILQSSNLNGVLAEAVDVVRQADFVLCVDADLAGQQWKINNRFFDKAVQVVLNPESTFLIFEHGAIDGQKAVSISESIATRYLADVNSFSRIRKNYDDLTAHSWTTQIVTLPDDVIAKARHYLTETGAKLSKTRHCFPSFGKSFFDDVTNKFDGPVSADNIIQLAVALTFFRLRNKLPSMYEPVSLAHMFPRRLDFISPLSSSSVEFIKLFDSANPDILRTKLIEAIRAHRAKVRRSKTGMGAASHLLALASAEFPEDKVKCVSIQGSRRRLLSRLSKTINFLAHRDVMVSNGGVSAYLESFSTIVHQPNMVGIGYLLGAKGLAVDVQLQGTYKDVFQPNVLACQFVQAIHDVTSILLPAHQPASIFKRNDVGISSSITWGDMCSTGAQSGRAYARKGISL